MSTAFTYTNSKGTTYILHAKTIKLKGSGVVRTIYFFAKEQQDGALNRVPPGWEVKETKNGLPVLKREQ